MRLLDSKLYNDDLKRVIDCIDLDMLRNKTILITGGLGLICSTIVDLLIAINHEKNANIRIVVGARDKNRFLERYGMEDVDFLLYEAQKEFICDFVPDYIIHGAGVSSPELYTKKPVETMLSNIIGVNNLLDFSANIGVSRLLYISSSEVYGIINTDNPFCEGKYGLIDIDNIRSSYPIAKRSAEMLCKSYSSEYGVYTIIVRPGHIYGPSASNSDNRISSEFSLLAAKGINLEMKSAGIQKRSYCYSVDAAVAILTVLTRGKKGEAYNIGHSHITSIREMAEIVARAGNVKLSTIEPTTQELASFNPMNNSSLDNKKLHDLGYNDSFNVEEGFEHTVRIMREIL